MNPRHIVRALPGRSAHRSRRQGFTLVELLVVIAIIGMLMALLVPAVQMARESGRRATCMNNQSNLGKAVLNYATAKDKFPPSFSVQPNPSSVMNMPAFVGWVPPMLSYIEQNALYQIFQNPTSGSNWLTQNGASISVLICPSRNATTPAPLSYTVNCGAPDFDPTAGVYSAGTPIDFPENGVFFDLYTPSVASAALKVPKTTTDMTYISKHDGNQYTLMLTESLDALDWILTGKPSDLAPPIAINRMSWWQGCTWDVFMMSQQPPFNSTLGANPTNTPIINKNAGLGATANSVPAFNPPSLPVELALARPSSNHPGGFMATFCGGNVQFVSQDIDYAVYYAIMTPDTNATKVPGKKTGSATIPVVVPWTSQQMQVSAETLNK